MKIALEGRLINNEDIDTLKKVVEYYKKNIKIDLDLEIDGDYFRLYKSKNQKGNNRKF